MGNKHVKQYHEQSRDLNPYDVFELSKNFTWEELTSAYRRTARIVHPDKGGSAEMFNAVTECFRILGNDFKARNADRPHYELKQESANFFESSSSRTNPSPEQAAQFNKFFDENKFEDFTDGGYGEQMAASTKAREDFKFEKIKADSKKFNQIFEERVPVTKDNSIVRFREPEALSLTSQIQFTELGGQRPNNYSSGVDITARRGNLEYTDYMQAHTTSRLVDAHAMEGRKEYKNVKQYEKARERSLKKEASPEEIAYRESLEATREATEAARRNRLQEYDTKVSSYFEKVTALMQAPEVRRLT